MIGREKKRVFSIAEAEGWCVGLRRAGGGSVRTRRWTRIYTRGEWRKTLHNL